MDVMDIKPEEFLWWVNFTKCYKEVTVDLKACAEDRKENEE